MKPGTRVIYRPPGAHPETGVVTGENEMYVFVRFEGDWYSKATPRELLEIVEPQVGGQWVSQ